MKDVPALTEATASATNGDPRDKEKEEKKMDLNAQLSM
jgi:hypothetical protein